MSAVAGKSGKRQSWVSEPLASKVSSPFIDFTIYLHLPFTSTYIKINKMLMHWITLLTFTINLHKKQQDVNALNHSVRSVCKQLSLTYGSRLHDTKTTSFWVINSNTTHPHHTPIEYVIIWWLIWDIQGYLSLICSSQDINRRQMSALWLLM